MPAGPANARADQSDGPQSPPPWSTPGKLFLASFLALYFELVIIRYLSTEIRVFAYLQNLPLIASFLGIGLGMFLGRPPGRLEKIFPLLALGLFALIAFAAPLHLTHLPFPSLDYFVWGEHGLGRLPRFFAALWFLVAVLTILALVVAFFVEFGGLVGQHFSGSSSLRAYAVNLAGSLTGILMFTLLALLETRPGAWMLVGFLIAVPFFLRFRWALVSFTLIVLITGIQQPDTFWSPYYRITLKSYGAPPGWAQPRAYQLDVNHDYHQRMVDLSSAFLGRYPDEEPNRSAYASYELPYRLVNDPGEVLIVGAGSGNDVAAALRHGAAHVDAVEIDPVIVRLGRQYHPERPYDSPRVTVYMDDARAFFKKATKKYDLIVFGYLDAHTMLSSYSSLRLDNYVYTLESFDEARRLLKDSGTFVLAFASGRTFVTDRMFATLAGAFGKPAVAYYTRYDGSGVVFIQGKARDSAPLLDFPLITEELASRQDSTILATDHWPFLYLSGRTIPLAVVLVLLVFIYSSKVLLRKAQVLSGFWERRNLHFFMLGAGFLLLETKGVTELALLFGSTWIVNAVVVGAFLLMAILANTLIMVCPVGRGISYAALLVFLVLGSFFPYSVLDALSTPVKILGAAVIVGLPVFFSGLVFSRSFRDSPVPSQALGINLFGAVVGGALENTVTLAGTPVLGVLAIALYTSSAVCLGKTVLRSEVVLPLPVEGSAD
jgi:SAM-dependent methyltransferase